MFAHHRFCQGLGFAALAAVCTVAFGQSAGTIYGTVYDSSGSVIAGATVTATNIGTNQQRITNASELGEYVISVLPAGKYEVQIFKEGFTPFLQQGIVLDVNTRVRADSTLQVQTGVQQVNVSAEASMVQANSTTLVQVVDERRVADLPLNGRNVLQLMTINAGVATQGTPAGVIENSTLGGGSYYFGAAINGSRGNGTNFLLDNADNNDSYTNIAAPSPNPDALQEVSIQTSTFDAEYGRGVGGVVNMVTRSGTNELHGAMFEYLRNYDLNAANFFSGRDALKRNQYGFGLGGPVVLPKLYNGRNKTFFFVSYQGTRNATAVPGTLAIAPSQAMKQGDFSAWLNANGTGAIHDPLAPNTYFPNNQIPASRFDPVSVKLMAYMPASTTSNYQYRFGSPTITSKDWQWVVRGDQKLTDKQQLSLRYFVLRYDLPWQIPDNNLYSTKAGQNGYEHNANVNHTYTITPRLLNSLSVSLLRLDAQSFPPANDSLSLQTLGARVIVPAEFPNLTIGISNWAGISIGIPYVNVIQNYQMGDTVSYVTGKNNLRIGFDVKRFRMDRLAAYNSDGSASFNGQMFSDSGKSNAGNAWAEFLMGQMSSWLQTSAWGERIYANYLSAYMQDDIRLTPRLTVNLGLRWEPFFDMNEINGERATFVPGRQSQRFPNAPLGLQYQGDPGFKNRLLPSRLSHFAPRAGAAYQLTPKLVLRAAYGIFYDQMMIVSNNRTPVGQPFVNSGAFVGPVPLSNPYGSGPPLNSAVAANPNSSFVFSPYGTWSLAAPDVRPGYMQNWNFILERQIGAGLLVRAGYIGSKGTHLLEGTEVNPGIYGPGATAANLNQRRPYQPIAGLQLSRADAWSKYNSLQLTVQKRLSHGFTILGNYTLSKSTDITSYASAEGANTGPDPFNHETNRGLSDFDTPQRLVVSGIWELPRLEKSNRLLRSVVGGWQNNFIFLAQSGAPFTVVSGVNNDLNGIGGDFAVFNGGDWRLPARSQQQQINQWFNTADFAINPVGSYGTAGRNQLRGPGMWNADYSLFKAFPIRERMKVQIRGEFFNFFNHTALSAPNPTVTSPAFGKITAAGSPRIVQIGLRLAF